jgi:hypothetical protein
MVTDRECLVVSYLILPLHLSFYFPCSPMLTVLSIGERASEFLKVDYYRETHSRPKL